MELISDLRAKIRHVLYPALEYSPTFNVLYRVARAKLPRKPSDVLEEYGKTWKAFSAHLEAAVTLDDWLFIESLEGQPAYHNVDGRLTRGRFDSNRFNQQIMGDTLEKYFPDITSITEFGCGLGRNLLALKRRYPNLKCYGYELCQEGVDIARMAADKFGIEVSYAKLDYVNGTEREYVFPHTDVGFTIHSLEQLPFTNSLALGNILRHVHKGSIHIEPIPENYPYSYRGVLGRIYHDRMNYLRNFDATVHSLHLRSVTHDTLRSAANPLVFPSLYVLHK